MYIDHSLSYKVIEKASNEAYQALWCEVMFSKKANFICGVIYRQHNNPDRFLDYFEESINRFSATGKAVYILGDVNISLLRLQTCNYVQQFLIVCRAILFYQQMTSQPGFIITLPR